MSRRGKTKRPSSAANAAATGASGPDARHAQRLDKWLWCVRITRTRGEAARLIEAGHVRLNRLKVKKPAAPLRIGDVLTVACFGQVRVYRVLGFSQRRVSAAIAATLREEL